MPVRHIDVLDWVSNNLWLGTQHPDFETESPFQALQANIADHLVEIGYDIYNQKVSDVM